LSIASDARGRAFLVRGVCGRLATIMHPRLCFLLAVSSHVVLHSTWASAQSSWADKATATQLLEDAEKLKAAGNLAAACPKYDESQRRRPDLDTLLKVADCYELVGKTASAWAAFREAKEMAAHQRGSGPSEPREEIARARIAALDPKLSRLTLQVAAPDTPGLEVRQDGKPVGRGVWGSAVPIDPGPYQLTASAPGKKTWSQTIELGAQGGAKIEVTVPALENESSVAPSIPAGASTNAAGSGSVMASTPAASPASTWTSQRTIGFVVMGIGGAAAAVGTIFGLMATSKVSDRDAICPSSTNCTREEAFRIAGLTDEAKADATRSQIGFVIGATAIVGGIALVLTAPSRRPETAMTARISPWMGTTSAGISLGGKW
jgi:hypothetical protein